MSLRWIEIGGRRVGEGHPCFIIAEMGLAHDGSLGAAHAFVDAAAAAGADAVKFQTHIASAEGTAEESFRVNVFPQDATRQDYWVRTAFAEEQWAGLKRRAEERGAVFLSSPFSLQAVQLLSRVGVPAWKIGSGEANNMPLLAEISRTGLPVILSTGMSLPEEIDRSVAAFLEAGVPLLLMQCTSRYPCPPEHLGLNMIAEYRRRYDVPVGFSDHSGETAPGIAAYALGACAVEVHVTFSRKSFGPDVAASVTFGQLEEMVKGVRLLERAFSSPVDKGREAEELEALRRQFTKSIVASRQLKKGSVIREGDVDFKKPGTGIPAAEVGTVVGRRLRRSLQGDELISPEDLDEP